MNNTSTIEYPCSSITKSSGFTPLMHAVMDKDLNQVKELIKNSKEDNFSKEGKSLDSKNTEGWTALMLACRNSNVGNKEIGLEIVKVLLKGGADPNLKNNKGWTALMHASRNSNTDSSIETVELLLSPKGGKADPNLKNNDGNTALMFASRYSNKESSIETVELLLKYKAKYDYNDFTKDEIILILDIKHKIELEEMKENHKIELETKLKNQEIKLLDEIYAPGGIGMEVAKERFEMCKKMY